MIEKESLGSRAYCGPFEIRGRVLFTSQRREPPAGENEGTMSAKPSHRIAAISAGLVAALARCLDKASACALDAASHQLAVPVAQRQPGSLAPRRNCRGADDVGEQNCSEPALGAGLHSGSPLPRASA